MPTIAVLGTFDTKGPEHAFVAGAIRAGGFTTLLIDVGCLEAPTIRPDVSADTVAAHGGDEWRAILARRDRGECVTLMGRAAAKLLTDFAASGKIHGVISLGGGGGTAIATAAMRALPIGFPKVMVSTLASGNIAPYVGTVDIVMIPAIVDVAGINRISRAVFENAAGAICGMVNAAENRRQQPATDKPLIVASMFGNTTACVTEARRIVEAAGYEVLVFAATGAGGRAMESLIASGMVAGVLDITTTEWADELVGGVLTAGRERLDAAAKAGVPAIVTPGCLDMVNFGEPSTVPAKFAGRTFYHHNAQVTLMRTTPAECAELGRILAEKINRYTASVTVLLPRRAISIICAPGQPFHDPAADEALFGALRTHLRPDIPVVDTDLEINDPVFARACADSLLAHLENNNITNHQSV
ncbi:MAG: Tm-1-like ATP-binding domain-containing protein [Verrucomicrobia bacterium]|nr:Tm-1-like ATP-binding domain-containing protein [Verrucomicrobiota bacterium]